MYIIGAGMSGMLAGQYFRHKNPIILEKQECLPNNHKALLRFRSDAVSKLTGISFRKVSVRKGVKFGDSLVDSVSIPIMNLYSKKVSGEYSDRSIRDLSTVERYIAPDDFIQKLSNGLDIQYSIPSEETESILVDPSVPVISTIPVHHLAEILGYNLPNSPKVMGIITLTSTIMEECDLYQTIYYPDHDSPIYRVSITGDHLIIEIISTNSNVMDVNLLEKISSSILETDFSVKSNVSEVRLHKQPYGKLVEAKDNSIKRFIQWATNNHNIYSLGRWGTHRQILMDDIVDDLTVIDSMMQSENYRR